jgi:hypothetical protein
MIHIGLSLLTVALESGAAHIGAFPSLMSLVSDELCKNLFMVRIRNDIKTRCDTCLKNGSFCEFKSIAITGEKICTCRTNLWKIGFLLIAFNVRIKLYSRE